MTTPIPRAITADRTQKKLSIEWNDGHISIYSFSLLRAACPCAECRGGHENMGDEPPAGVFATPITDTPQTRLVRVEAVGSYAAMFTWEDGHHFGIYNWHYLRALCPCSECQTGD